MVDELRIGPDDWDAAISDADGYQLVVAGPGTGKTEFLVRRVHHLIESDKAAREEILVLTFSRRAANDIRRRVDEHGGGAGSVPIDSTTFHSLALRILETASPENPPSPLTTPEQIGLVGELLGEEDPGLWPIVYRGVLGSSGFAEEVADFLMRCSERLLSPDGLAARAADRADWRRLPGFYQRYLEELSARNRADYGTLLTSAVSALESREFEGEMPAFKYVLVDEYQDTSPAQARLAALLAAQSGNLTVTGDPYQSIYSFRGADLHNISQFQDEHAGFKRIVLTDSFRVPAPIMEAALRVVSSGHLPGSAGQVTPAGHPGRVDAYIFDQETAEAEWIAARVERAIHVEGIAPNRIAVLLRSKREMLNELSRALERRLIPHERPDRRLVDHPAVRMFADLVTLSIAESDPDRSDAAGADGAARRILLGPLVGVSLGEYRKLRTDRLVLGSWGQAFLQHEELGDIGNFIGNDSWATDAVASDGFWKAWTGVEMIARLVEDEQRREWRSALASFSQVLARQSERDASITLARFFDLAEDEQFEATPLISHRANGSGVLLTTLHQAKGLEFDHVIIANAVEGVFPDLRRSRRMLRPELLSANLADDPSSASRFQIQEEMRLAYTAMCRARQSVTWTATDASVDLGEQRPSRFLVSAAGVATLGELSGPEREIGTPVTIAEAETLLRRMSADPGHPAAERIAAVRVLADSPVGAWDIGRFAGVPSPGPDRPIIGDTFAMSPSQADAYLQCPRRYALERRLRIGDASSVHMQSGSLIHDVLETAELEIVGSGEVHNRLERALETLRTKWEQADFGSPALNKAWLDKARRIVTKLYESWPEGSGPPIDLEKEVQLEIDGVVWYGIIDRLEEVDDGLRVVDYKTGTTMLSLPEAATSIQLGFYAMAINASTEGPNVVAAELWYPAIKSASLTIRKLDIDRLDEVEQTIRDVTAGVSGENWEPRVSKRCDRCAFRPSCPAWPEGRGAFLA